MTYSTTPRLVPIDTVIRAITLALLPYVFGDDDTPTEQIAESCARNAVHALLDPDGAASPAAAIADSLMRFARLGKARHVVCAAHKGAIAYLAAERPTLTMRVAMLRELGVRDPYEWLKQHELDEVTGVCRAPSVMTRDDIGGAA